MQKVRHSRLNYQVSVFPDIQTDISLNLSYGRVTTDNMCYSKAVAQKQTIQSTRSRKLGFELKPFLLTTKKLIVNLLDINLFLLLRKTWWINHLQERIQDFWKVVTFAKGVTIHCLITKIYELRACCLHFPYVLAQNGEWLVIHSPLDPPLIL